ncbi:transposase [Peribacillus sp. JNUCC 23]
MEEWRNLANDSNIGAFKTFNRWKTEILNSSVYPYRNGYIEGVNNNTKVINRNSYGIKNFGYLRRKILWRQLIREVSA